MQRFAPFLALALLAPVMLALVYGDSFQSAIAGLEARGKVQLTQAADRLLGQLEPYQQLPNVLARHPDVLDALGGKRQGDGGNSFLAMTALTVGADAILVLDPGGRVVAASDYETPETTLNRRLRAPYLRRAMEGALGVDHGIEAQPQTAAPGGYRVFYVARGIIAGAAPPVGVVLVRVDAAQLEFDWEGDEAVLAFFDRQGVVFVTNRPDLALSRTDGPGPGKGRYVGVDHRAFPAMTETRFGVARTGSALLPARTLVLAAPMPRIGLEAHIYLDAAPAAATAQLFTALAAALLALAAAAYWALSQRRRRLADRLAAEARANARLEAAVEDRTAQLRAAQDRLVQAGRLAALGQMSAGISHELTQPLAAIRNYAENGVKLLDRDRSGETRQNLMAVSGQVDRIGRIIANLRDFARGDPAEPGPLDLGPVISAAVDLADLCVPVTVDSPAASVRAIAGEVRLTQVLVNLLVNAGDAVGETGEVRVTLRDGPPRITVDDTGPGITSPERVFEPFYTTKEVGASKGLGLGLSISYGIVGSFGGRLSCENTGTGARFTVKLCPP
ncbi:MAG: ATP-binding protein [Pseudomonadota bacterium]